RVTLTKLNHAFTAEITNNSAKVLHRHPDGLTEPIGQIDSNFAAGSPIEVEFQNVDYTVILRINGKDLIRSTPQQYAPDVPDLLKRHDQRMSLAYNATPKAQIRNVCPPPTISISAEKQACQLSHLSLWRDI